MAKRMHENHQNRSSRKTIQHECRPEKHPTDARKASKVIFQQDHVHSHSRRREKTNGELGPPKNRPHGSIGPDILRAPQKLRAPRDLRTPRELRAQQEFRGSKPQEGSELHESSEIQKTSEPHESSEIHERSALPNSSELHQILESSELLKNRRSMSESRTGR